MFNSYKKWIGKTLGNYKVIKRMGEGRYGVCYLASTLNHEWVVIKKFKPFMYKINKHKNANEAVILSQIHHTSIPQLLGIINQQNFYGYVLEYVPGTTVESILFKQKYNFSNPEIASIGQQLIDILKYLHNLGIVHRDIRIPNVLLDDNNKVYLIDFGLARWVDHDRYTFEQDYTYLGDFLLYLHYSSYEKGESKNKPWYEELDLTEIQINFYKRLLSIKTPYSSIYEIEQDFHCSFSSTMK